MTLFDKTERGRAEIATRGHNISPRLRTLLLLVDGKTSTEVLLTKVAGLGLGQEQLSELLAAGLIQPQLGAQQNPEATSKIETTEISSTARAILPQAGQTHQIPTELKPRT